MADFPLLVPRPYLSRIRPGDPEDPLLLQVLPQGESNFRVPQFTADPLGEVSAPCSPGVLKKYRGRLLIVTTEAVASIVVSASAGIFRYPCCHYCDDRAFRQRHRLTRRSRK